MKIFILGGDSGNYPSFFYQCIKALRDLGHEVDFFNYRPYKLHKFAVSNSVLNKYFLNKIIKLNPDILIVIKGESLLKGVINKINSKGIKTACWALDEPFGRIYSMNKINNIPEYNYFFVFDPSYLDELKEINSNSFYLPVAADPINVHKESIPIVNRDYSYDISFLGSYEPEREELFFSLGFPLTIFGMGWGKVKSNKKIKVINRPLFGKEMNKFFNNSKINLNIQALHGKESMNLRTFEVPATKSFVLTDFKKELPNLFELDKEIVCYYDKEDLKEKISYYLENEKERNKIALAGHERVMRDHKIIDRLRTMLKIIDL
jgi:spore maturation protein CgeB